MPAPTRTNAQRIELPEGFTTIRDLLDSNRRVGALVNVIGVVIDFRAPVETRGTDWKCQIGLYDHTTSEFDDEKILLNLFRPQAEMPDASLGDVVMVFKAKVQTMSGTTSLISNWATEVYLWSSNKIPRPPANASAAMKSPTKKIQNHKPDRAEHVLVSTFYHSIQKAKMPTRAEFDDLKLRSVAFVPGKKYKQLRHVAVDSFADLLVQIVKEPYAQGDLCSFWVSDYTEHDAFYRFSFKGLSDNPFGHTTGLDMVDQHGSQWAGPYGQRSLQVTCFEPHASSVRDLKLSAGDWIELRNVQIKFGHNGANLEGYLREDRNPRGGKEQIARLSLDGDRDAVDPRLKEALIRKRDYEKEKKAQIKSLAEAASDGRKRKAAVEQSESKANSREKRRQRRAHMQQKQPESAPPPAGSTSKTDKPEGAPVSLNLNPQVKCEHQDKPASTIREILQDPPPLTTTVNGQELQLSLPFRNVNYRANVRVINFAPSRLEDFSFARTQSEFDILSDPDSSPGSDSSAVSQSSPDPATLPHTHARHSRRKWEWRFFLELEDAVPPPTDDTSSTRRRADDQQGRDAAAINTIWVSVDNNAAQCLVDLDASNLAEDADALDALRQRMFLLWGELEEHKTQELETRKRSANGNVPPADSDDENKNDNKDSNNGDNTMNNRHKHTTNDVNKGARQRAFINRPFACCIKEYGFKVPEPDPCRADAGEGKRWQRAFALFGTRITD